ncbi:pilin [Candidatus Saccharibacteria bacterium]|nr:pilin [Candidatus Saccharibacteria bacterium]
MRLGDLNLLNSTNLPKTNDNVIKTVLTDTFILLGAISLLMIVIAGLRYIFARGNAEATAQAKNMITYSVMGLIIAALAASIVSVVLNRAG